MVKCGPYLCHRTIGKGAISKVFLATQEDDASICALKVMKKKKNCEKYTEQFAQKEAKILKAVAHPNIINLLKFCEDETYDEGGIHHRKVAYMALEYARNGDLVNMLRRFGKFPETLARFYTIELIKAVEHVHFKGYSHLDLKPDNVLFDSEFNLKICDFSLSSERKMIKIKRGTKMYCPEEIFTSEYYHGPSTDIYAIGMIIFVMVTGHLPFREPELKDLRYRYLQNKSFEKFWEVTCKTKSSKYATRFYTEEFKNLFVWILSPSAVERPSLAEIMEHDWLCQEAMSREDAIDYFKQFE
ncbi:unnamed protein product [Moneuplotes crassus]|uniref:Protein kinase domain-containing protein n=1 Tax=Euplotes crassus TaxID=5936 RepID=A0AAD1XMX0_EUPCR|nr:unnamed protein product [Moneuplotes crassus]